MSRLQAKRRFVGGIACIWALSALAGGGVAWGAAKPHPHIGKLPGFPVLRGVVPVLGSGAALSAHEQLVKGAFSAARAKHPTAQRLLGLSASPVTNESEEPLCVSELEEELTFETQDVCYRGGPVARDPQIHLIFWQGLVEEDISKEEHVKLFPPHYIETVGALFRGPRT